MGCGWAPRHGRHLPAVLVQLDRLEQRERVLLAPLVVGRRVQVVPHGQIGTSRQRRQVQRHAERSGTFEDRAAARRRGLALVLRTRRERRRAVVDQPPMLEELVEPTDRRRIERQVPPALCQRERQRRLLPVRTDDKIARLPKSRDRGRRWMR
eukprot:4175293-Prymnesium_polylepis.1